MNKPAKIVSAKRPTNVSLTIELVEEAKRLGVNLSQACEQGLFRQVSETRAERWKRENRAALESSNAYIEKHGLPLARFRQF